MWNVSFVVFGRISTGPCACLWCSAQSIRAVSLFILPVLVELGAGSSAHALAVRVDPL